MPVAHFHLPASTFTAGQERDLLVRASATYSRVLDSPIERVRAFLVHYPASSIAVAGVLDSVSPAPSSRQSSSPAAASSSGRSYWGR